MTLSQCGKMPEGLEPRFWEPATAEWGTFSRESGRIMRYMMAMPEGQAPDGAVLDLQGLNEFIEKNFELHNQALASNYAVFTFDWMGQGGSARYIDGSQRRHSHSFDKDIGDIAYFMSHKVLPRLRDRRASSTPLRLSAHSMGGHMALRLLGNMRGIFERATLSAPMIDFAMPLPVLNKDLPTWAKAPMAYALSTALGYKSYALGETDWKADNPRRQPETDAYTSDRVRGALNNAWMITNPELQIGGVTNGWLLEARKSITKMWNDLQRISTPLTIGVSTLDQSVLNSPIYKAVRRIPSHTNVLTFDGARHEIWMEQDKFRDPLVDSLLTHDF